MLCRCGRRLRQLLTRRRIVWLLAPACLLLMFVLHIMMCVLGAFCFPDRLMSVLALESPLDALHNRQLSEVPAGPQGLGQVFVSTHGHTMHRPADTHVPKLPQPGFSEGNKTKSGVNVTFSSLQMRRNSSLTREVTTGNVDTTAGGTSGQFNLTEWGRTQEERKHLLREGCKKYMVRTTDSDAYNSRSIVNLDKNFLYCPVEKAASTFLRRFMFSLQHSSSSKEIASPFDIPIKTALSYRYDGLQSLYRRGINFWTRNSTKFVVLREPFSRLFSAYVDKVLVPNSYYWKVWAVRIVSRFRNSPSPRALHCGHDVTFAEFIKYVIQTLHRTDEHVKPVRHLCAPCYINFSVISHMETLKSDFQYLVSLLKINIANFSANTLSAEMRSDAILDSTYSAFEFYEKLKPCVTLYETCKRLWHKMQLRGIISDDMPFPLSVQEAEKLSASEMVHLLEEAGKNSRNTEKLRQQKVDALKNAYANVSSQDLDRLLSIYQLDFDLFGFEKHPSFIGRRR